MTPREQTRLPVTKTPKVYIGGAFVRSESSRTFKISASDGAFFANIPQCTRKDLRNAVEAAAKAGPGWARRTPYNRAQILYRLAEMIEARSGELVDSLDLASSRDYLGDRPCFSPDGRSFFAGTGRGLTLRFALGE